MKKAINIPKPLLHRVVVKVDKVEELEKSVIQVIDKYKDRESAAMESGVVIYVGDTAFKDYGFNESPIKKGDHVHFLKHAGVIKKIGNDDYRVLNDIDLYAVD